MYSKPQSQSPYATCIFLLLHEMYGIVYVYTIARIYISFFTVVNTLVRNGWVARLFSLIVDNS